MIVEKPNVKLRICIDPRELHKYLKTEQYQLPTWKKYQSDYMEKNISAH